MADDAATLLHCCLYFTAGSLAREMSAMAEDAFAPTGLNPSQAFALLCVVDEPGIQPSRIATRLALAASTVTRIIDALAARGFVAAAAEGRAIRLEATDKGDAMADLTRVAWKQLYDAYADKLGKDRADALCAQIHEANEDLRRQPASEERNPA